jgi:plastocyanin domain-containing protein
MRAFLPLAAALALGALPFAARAEGAARSAKPHAARAAAVHEIAVTSDGFVPATIQVKRGEPVKLVVTRKTARTCATEIVIKDYAVNQPLPLDKPVTIELTPKKSGQVRYACGMDMISGVLQIE